ncbi:MAG TPA: conjugal transfer protein [Solirubrobacterales bacterium]|nr:conjugal transfer protein [Solirubrobacterales bacterium]
MALRTAGRAALWALVGLLLLRGAASVLADPQQSDRATVSPSAVLDPTTGSFAVRFARAYLGGASPQELAPLLASGVTMPSAGTSASGVEIQQAEVAGSEAAGDGQAIVTVACELADARTIFLAVPTVREGADGVAAAGAPAVVAGPAGVGEDVASPRPIAGPEAAAIGELVRRFLPTYLSASEPADLSYLLAPGAVVVPPGNGLRLLGVTAVKQIGDEEGSRRTVLATARVRDPLSGASFGLAYRLDVVRHGRWYIERVEGALS